MQFSILGVPFKCTKDMFTWEKIKWSLCVCWSEFWRIFIVSASIFILALMIRKFTFHLEEEDMVYFFIAGGKLLAYLFRPYIKYYVYFRKNFNSFIRCFEQYPRPAFWSWAFWKPYLITNPHILASMSTLIIIMSKLIWPHSIFIGFGFSLSNPSINIILFIVNAIFLHIFLHGGTWGFVPARK